MLTSSAIDLHLRKLRARDDVGLAEEKAIASLFTEVLDVPKHRTLVHHGQELNQSILLLEGWTARAKDLPNGQRQIAEINLPGDFVDLHGFTLKRLDHNIVTISRCRVALAPHERLTELTNRFPHLARLYWFNTNLDASIHREWALSLGRRTAIARLAHLFCELNIRLEIGGLARDNSYDFPMTQNELGEALGLTAVHVNRTLQQLRRDGLVELHNRRVTIIDLEGLKELADFDGDYLHLRKRSL